jgi:two-component system, sensor histidine kinase PdtaS
MRAIAAIILLCLFSGLSAQSRVDSIKHRIQESLRKNQTESIANQYAQLAYHFNLQGAYDSAIFYYQKSLAVKSPRVDMALLASSLNEIAIAYGYLGRLDSSIRYYNKSLTAYSSMKDSLHVAVIETNLAIAYKNLTLYDKALEYSFRAIEHHEQLQQWQSLGSAYNTVSLVYLKVRDYKNALSFARKSLATRKKVGYTRGIGISYNNIGEIHLATKNYDSALVNLRASLRIKKENNDRKSFSHTLYNLGTVLFSLKRIGEAEDYFNQSLELRREFKDRVGEIECYNSLAKVALYEKNHQKAEIFLRQAENLLKEENYPELRRDNLELRIQMSDQIHQPAQSARYLRELLVVKDSILNRDKAESMNALQVQYETEVKENQILLLEEQGQLKTAEIRTKQILIYSLALAIVLLLVIALLIYKNFQTVRRSKDSYQLLLGELHHRVKNNLQLLASVLSLQSQQLKDENALMTAKSIESRVNAMALIHRKLYGGGRARTINIREYVHELIDFLVYSYGFNKGALRIDLAVPDIEVDVDKAIPLGLILNEVISNSLKYAYHEHPDPSLVLAVNQSSNSDLEVRVSDNGKGFEYNPGADSEDSFGLKMIRLLIKELKGSVRIEATNGTSVYLKIALL